MARTSWLIAAWPLSCGGPSPVETLDGSDSTTAATHAPADESDSGSAADETSSTETGSTEMGTTANEVTEGSDDTGPEPVGVYFHTLLTDDGHLALASNLPPQLEDCVSLHIDTPCEDADEDGLTDAWEDAVLDRLRPLRRMDEDESLFDDAAAVIADVGRVVGMGDRYRLFVMLGYSRDYGSCGFTAHNGDSERVALDLAPYPAGGAGGVVVVGAYTAAHEGTITDHSRLFVGPDLAVLEFEADAAHDDEPRWIVYPSQDKHATYASIEICENVSFLPCFDEDCAPDGVRDPEAFDLLPESVNAGEEHAPRVDDLGPVGFPGDSAWADQPFCGGLGGSGCSSPVREKLLVDPF
jgi:hypothetical protein